MTVFAVEYVYDSARTDDIAALRPQHREFIARLHEEGSVLASGPWEDNAAPGALVIMSAEDADAVQRLLDEDPFHQAHLITQRTLRPWKPILGPFAT